MLILFTLAFFSPVFAMIGAAVLYPRQRIRAWLYVLLVALAAVIAPGVGVIGSVDIVCAPSAGNLCGLGSVFVIGPLTFAGAVLRVALSFAFFAA